MYHFFLLFISIVTIEILSRLNFSNNIYSIFKVFKKLIKVISNPKISDHWKEITVPFYSFQIIKDSSKTLLSFLMIIMIFVIFFVFEKNFFLFALSWIGVLETIFISLTYVYIRKILK